MAPGAQLQAAVLVTAAFLLAAGFPVAGLIALAH
jgi:hypothetical protein